MDWDSAWDASRAVPTCPSLLLHNFGILKFASYPVSPTRLFVSRRHLDAYQSAIRLREKIWSLLGIAPVAGEAGAKGGGGEARALGAAAAGEWTNVCVLVDAARDPGLSHPQVRNPTPIPGPLSPE